MNWQELVGEFRFGMQRSPGKKDEMCRQNMEILYDVTTRHRTREVHEKGKALK
jgi:hypothetical protein